MAINRTGNDGQVNRARASADTSRTNRTELGGNMIGTRVSRGDRGGLAGSYAPEISASLNSVTRGLGGGGGGGGGARGLE